MEAATGNLENCRKNFKHTARCVSEKLDELEQLKKRARDLDAKTATLHMSTTTATEELKTVTCALSTMKNEETLLLDAKELCERTLTSKQEIAESVEQCWEIAKKEPIMSCARKAIVQCFQAAAMELQVAEGKAEEARTAHKSAHAASEAKEKELHRVQDKEASLTRDLADVEKEKASVLQAVNCVQEHVEVAQKAHADDQAQLKESEQLLDKAQEALFSGLRKRKVSCLEALAEATKNAELAHNDNVGFHLLLKDFFVNPKEALLAAKDKALAALFDWRKKAPEHMYYNFQRVAGQFAKSGNAHLTPLAKQRGEGNDKVKSAYNRLLETVVLALPEVRKVNASDVPAATLEFGHTAHTKLNAGTYSADALWVAVDTAALSEPARKRARTM